MSEPQIPTIDPLLRHHGDADVGGGLIDFAVNVQGDGPPPWLRSRLSDAIASLGSYPTAQADLAAREQVAAHHGRTPDEVVLLAGGAEGFAMLPRLNPTLAAVIHPSFTEPEWVLRQAGIAVEQVILPPPFRLDPASVPEAADMVVIGNPVNPTSVLHDRDTVLRLRRPGRILVVDEAFADAVAGPGQSLASDSLGDVLVLRSLTKTWALAGLRCGYALGHPDVLSVLVRGRSHWPVGSLQIEAVRACIEPDAVAESRRIAARIAEDRRAMADRLLGVGLAVLGPAAAPFLLVKAPGAEQLRLGLRERGIAVRRCDTFPGLGDDYLRIAVRSPETVDKLIGVLSDLVH